MEDYNITNINKILLEVNYSTLDQCYLEGFYAKSLSENSYPKYSSCYRQWLDGYLAKEYSINTENTNNFTK
ncbi:MAG: hypothetical protein HRT87_11550 [Legionellales bacterium]|nr:hypothetical protein [Legionellales bacterium]